MNYTSMKLSFITLVCTKLLSIVVIALLFSFGLHSIQISHSHPGHQNTTQENHHEKKIPQTGDFPEIFVSMHAADKKLFLIMTPVWSLVATLPATVYTDWKTYLMLVALFIAQALSQNRKLSRSFFPYLQVSLSQGILNPKLY